MNATTSRPVMLWLVGRDYSEYGPACAKLIRSRNRWPRVRARAERRLWAVCKAAGYDGKRDWQSILDWLKSIDWAKVMKIVASVIALLLTFL